jgi:hypothetical protein
VQGCWGFGRDYWACIGNIQARNNQVIMANTVSDGFVIATLGKKVKFLSGSLLGRVYLKSIMNETLSK